MSDPAYFLSEHTVRCSCVLGEICELCNSTGYVHPEVPVSTGPEMTTLTSEVKAVLSTITANLERAQASGYPLTDVSPAEMALAAALERAGVTDFEQQYPVGPFFTDFFFTDCKLAVEVDGAEWHRDAEKDLKRSMYLLDNGVRKVLRLRAARVFADGPACVAQVTEARRRLA